MCGIIGVSGLADAAKLTYLGLYALQHRGQESAGIVAIDGEGRPRSFRGMGLVSETFDEDILAQLPGDVAVGHTRYSTTGSTVLANAQPCSVSTHSGPLAIAHNGNLTNAAELKHELVERGAIFTTSTDTEVLVHLIARSEATAWTTGSGTPSSRWTARTAWCSRSAGPCMRSSTAAGFRPLVLGRLNGGIIAASETCALDLVGATLVRELKPGDFLKIPGWRGHRAAPSLAPMLEQEQRLGARR